MLHVHSHHLFFFHLSLIQLLPPPSGDFGFDPMGQLKGKSEKAVNELKLKELKNGRLAMVAIMGMFVQNLAFPGVPTLSF